jgi:putative flippase GtrA
MPPKSWGKNELHALPRDGLSREELGRGLYVSFEIGYKSDWMEPKEESRVTRIARFLRSAATGGFATIADFATLTALVELAGLRPEVANVPSLLVGVMVQFIGHRSIVFAARGRPVGPQAAGFALVEAGTLLLNAVGFHLLVAAAHMPYAIARATCSFFVYVCFSYPLWKRVFR